MARARNIKPGFFRNEILAELPPLTRLLFAGLWTIADREGRIEDRPKRIKADVLPYDDSDVDAMLTDLHGAGFIVRYAVGEGRYIQVQNFRKHQNPHVKEGESTIPAPPDLGESGTSTVQAPDKNSINPADSLNPITDSPILDSPIPQRASAQDERFNRFWNAYPKRVGKDAARKAWDKRKPSEGMTVTMLDAIERQKQSLQWCKDGGQYIPNPATWLNQGRWQDDPVVQVPNGSLTLMNTGKPRASPGKRGYTGDELLAMSREDTGT